jgi:hypothetical protein
MALKCLEISRAFGIMDHDWTILLVEIVYT